MSTADPGRVPEWHIVTSEYPPAVGGVSDYVRTLARALVASRPVHVWCPARSNAKAGLDDGVLVHPVIRSFSPRSLRRLGHDLDRHPAPRRLFVQWVPQGFGYRSLNVGFGFWLAWRSMGRGDHLHLMVHEPYLPWSAQPSRFMAALAHRIMLVLAARGAERVWLSTPSWKALVSPFISRSTPVAWLPVPAPSTAASRASTDAPASPGNRRPFTIGHFGTYSPLITPMLGKAMSAVLAGSDASILLVGHGSDAFRSDYLRVHPNYADRVRATGALPSETIAEHLRSCDAMMQPYPDGVTARRTSTLTLLALGVPVVTNAGRLSESFWNDGRSVVLVDTPVGELIGAATLGLLSDHQGRASLGARGQDLYDRRFAVRHAVALLETAACAQSSAA